MNVVNLRTITELSEKSDELFNRYKRVMGIELRDHELATLRGFVSEVPANISLDGFYVNYCIPQLGKEMDLFRVNSNGELVNIELKAGNKTIYEMEKQLKTNRYYFTGAGFSNIVQYSYKLENNELYRLEGENLISVDVSDLINHMGLAYSEIDLNSCFSPKKYLISPFNQPNEFIASKYILTTQQQDIQRSILKDDGMRHLIIGSAGTGKSLLVYSTAIKLAAGGKRVTVVHGGNLNSGHRYINQFTQISVKAIKEINDFENWSSDYDVISVDEFQRFSLEQVQGLLENYKGKIIFSGDPHQWLSDSEDGDKLEKGITDSKNVDKHKLTHKIRTNRELSQFVQYLFNTAYDGNYSSAESSKISVDYFSNIDDAKIQLRSLQRNGWKVLVPTGSFFGGEYYTELENELGFENAHNVIGQEFEKIATVIGPNFSYDENHKLTSTGTYYPTKKSLFQNLTRARDRIRVVIIDNIEVFNQATHILEKSLK